MTTPASSSQAGPLRLPSVPQSGLGVRPVDWSGLEPYYLNEGELEVIVALMRSVRPRAVLELGVNEGRTAKGILQNVEGIEHYQGIDVAAGYVPSLAVQRGEVPADPGWMVRGDPRFELIVRPRGSLDLGVGDLGPCDAAFIDGDHGWRAVLHDTLLAWRLVRPGGIIIWHDYNALGEVEVRDVLETLAATGSAIEHVEDTWLAFERR